MRTRSTSRSSPTTAATSPTPSSPPRRRIRRGHRFPQRPRTRDRGRRGGNLLLRSRVHPRRPPAASAWSRSTGPTRPNAAGSASPTRSTPTQPPAPPCPDGLQRAQGRHRQRHTRPPQRRPVRGQGPHRRPEPDRAHPHHRPRTPSAPISCPARKTAVRMPVRRVAGSVTVVKLSVQVKLLPTPVQAAALGGNPHPCNQAATWVSSGGVREGHQAQLRPASEHLYGRSRTGGGSARRQPQHVIKKTCDAYTTLKANLKAGNLGKPSSKRYRRAVEKPIAFRPEGAPAV